MTETFNAVVIEDVDGKPKAAIRELTTADLPDHDTLIEVDYSSLNYKDGLAVSGKGRIARKLPLIAGPTSLEQSWKALTRNGFPAPG